MAPVVVLADDRTGALETAGALARAARPVLVEPFGPSPSHRPGRTTVVDMATRHRSPEQAAERVTRLASALADAVVLLKMDSTLRGNWASEALALASVRRSPTLIVAAFPAVGRICVDGQVLDHGTPVASGPAGVDPRNPVTTSRPDELLVAAGAGDVTRCCDHTELEEWLAGAPPDGVAVCDASTEADLVALGGVWARSGKVSFVGTAASIAAAVAATTVAATTGEEATLEGAMAEYRPPVGLPALVCIGSLHPAARRQAAVLAEHGWSVEVVGASDRGDVTDRHVVLTPVPSGGIGDPRAATALADVVARRLGERRWNTLVVVGGETASAVLGERSVVVGGLLGPGIPWGHLGDRSTLVITKPGGFAGPDAIVRLFDETA